MGLDITAYSKLTEVDERDACDIVIAKELLDFTEANFPGRTAGLTVGRYVVDDGGESFGFRAGSYGGYNQWRNDLAIFAGHGSAEAVWNLSRDVTGPFVELINFADNEGYIGPTVSAKLAKDFADHAARCLEQAPDEYFVLSYQNWAKAFAIAADGGLVDFH